MLHILKYSLSMVTRSVRKKSGAKMKVEKVSWERAILSTPATAAVEKIKSSQVKAALQCT